MKNWQQLLTLKKLAKKIQPKPEPDNTAKFLFFLTAFNLFLVIMRVFISSRPTFAFLGWNLFLAWIPYLSSTILTRVIKNRYLLFVLPLLATWLAFLPNSPYILTDLIHLKTRPGIPLWFDLMMLLSFAINGLMLALASISDVHDYLRHYFPNWVSHVLIASSIFLTSYGIYLGRILRWNSWNLLTHPSLILETFFKQMLLQSNSTLPALGITGFFFLFLSFCYLSYRGIKRALLIIRHQ